MSGQLHPSWGATPWHADEHGNVWARDGQAVARVAFIQGPPAESMAKERAIGRLIAAAPGLAEALGNLCLEAHHFADNKLGEQFLRASVERARALLAALEPQQVRA